MFATFDLVFLVNESAFLCVVVEANTARMSNWREIVRSMTLTNCLSSFPATHGKLLIPKIMLFIKSVFVEMWIFPGVGRQVLFVCVT